MTIGFTAPRETESLLKSSKPTFFPQVHINLQHFQLKHRISTRDADVIYYCSDHEIYALDIGNQKLELVKSLSWGPQCLDAAHGWICAAAEKGRCGFINVAGQHSGQPQPTSRQHRTEVDELLHLDLNPGSRSLMTQEVGHSASANGRATKYILHNHFLGTDIVNSVTIHKMKSVRRGLEDEVVVILTNNDKTVRIFSLSQLKALVTLEFKVPMNHATISPDGNLLLAVGDKGQAFFHRRVPFENTAIFGDKAFSTFGWIAIAQPSLPRTALNDQCFCTGFSPSGHRCVVASEGGVIIVYDTSLISDEMERDDAIICVMRTSRPSISPDFIGAARSMSFSPSPWDLLVVAEDQGRVTVLDTRSPEFMFRQTLDLRISPSDVVTETFPEVLPTLRQRQIDIEQRFLRSHRETMDMRNQHAAMTNNPSHLEHAVERQHNQGGVISGEVLALAESAIIESIESIGANYPRTNDSSSNTAPINVNHTPSSSNRGNAETLSSIDQPLGAALARVPSMREHADRASANANNLSDSAISSNPALAGRDHHFPRTASISEYMQQRNVERQRTSERQPRRRSSIVISNSGSRNNQSNPPALAPIGTSTPTLSTSPLRLPSSTSTSSSPAPPTITHDTTPPSRAASSLTTPEYWPTSEDRWRNATATIEALTATNTNTGHDEALNEASALIARARREAGVSTSRQPTSDLQATDGTPFTMPNPRIYQQTMQSLLARTERARHELARNESEMARNELARSESEIARSRMAGIDVVRTGMQRMDRAANRVRELVQTQAGEALRPPSIWQRSRLGGLVVQGVGWSQDGRSLFVATEVGLLQYEVNIRERMQWPGVAFL